MTETRFATDGAKAAGQGTERNVVVEGPGRVAVREEPRGPVPAHGERRWQDQRKKPQSASSAF